MYSFKEEKRLNKMGELCELYDIIRQQNSNDIKNIIESHLDMRQLTASNAFSPEAASSSLQYGSKPRS